jgi:hypothetical protein
MKTKTALFKDNQIENKPISFNDDFKIDSEDWYKFAIVNLSSTY